MASSAAPASTPSSASSSPSSSLLETSNASIGGLIQQQNVNAALAKQEQLAQGFVQLLAPVADAVDAKLLGLAKAQLTLSQKVDSLLNGLMMITSMLSCTSRLELIACRLLVLQEMASLSDFDGLLDGAQTLANTRKRLARVRDILGGVRKRVDSVKAHLIRIDAPMQTPPPIGSPITSSHVSAEQQGGYVSAVMK